MKKIIFVGSNPARKSTTLSPFHLSTKSGAMLDKWVDMIGGWTMVHVRLNVTGVKTPNNRALTLKEIKHALPDFKNLLDMWDYNDHHVVALGKTAAKALTLLQIPFYEMPHPSGLNRLLNDEAYVEGKIKGLLDFIQQPLVSNELDKAD